MIFLKPDELRLIKFDFEKIIKGADGTPVTISYETTAFPGAPPVIDAAFGRNIGPPDPTGKKSLSVRAIQEIVKPRSVKLLSIGFLEVGDSIFYIQKSVNMAEPVAGYPALWESLRITDPGEAVWKPKVLPSAIIAKLAIERIGSEQVCQVIACSPDT